MGGWGSERYIAIVGVVFSCVLVCAFVGVGVCACMGVCGNMCFRTRMGEQARARAQLHVGHHRR